jgi:hypothetical protein
MNKVGDAAKSGEVNVPENMPLRLDVRQGELDLPVYPPRANQRRIKTLNPVRSHDNFHIPPRIEPIKLIQKLQHSTLNLAFTTTGRIVPLRTNRIDLVDKDD